MKKTVTFLLVLVSTVMLCSCQKTNISDLMDYSRVRDSKVAEYAHEVKLKFGRDALLMDSLDKVGEKISLSSGTTVTVMGLQHQLGKKKTYPAFFRENYTPGVDVWVVRLNDGRRVLMEVPEMAIGVMGKDSVMITDVKKKPDSYLYLYKTSASNEWTDNPGIHYAAPKNMLVYFPHRHYVRCMRALDEVENPAWWQKALKWLGGPIDFFSKYTLSYFLYRDAAFYRWHPLLTLTDFWARALQLVLSWLLLFPLLAFVPGKVGVRLIWWIPLLPNWLVTVLGTVLTYVMFFIIGAFLGIEGGAYVPWLLLLAIPLWSAAKDEVEWNRCPHCHRIGLGFKGTDTSKWHHSTREHDNIEEKSRSTRDYDTYENGERVRVHETTIEKGVRHYTDLIRRRHHTEHLYCKHCHRPITIDWDEEHTTETSHWK